MPWLMVTGWNSHPLRCRPMMAGSQTRATAVPCRGQGGGPPAGKQRTGRIIWGNLCTLNLLQGTAARGGRCRPHAGGRHQHRSHDLWPGPHLPVSAAGRGRHPSPGAGQVPILERCVPREPGLPVLANVDFGPTQPQLTLPIGGQAELRVNAAGSRLKLGDR